MAKSTKADSKLQIPAPGTIVTFTPNALQRKTLLADKLKGAETLPAMVTLVDAEDERALHLCAFLPIDGTASCASVKHKSEAAKDAPYWE